MDAQVLQISQSLFLRRGADGYTWEFAALTGGGCALLRNGTAVDTRDGSQESVELVLQEFLNRSGARLVSTVVSPDHHALMNDSSQSPHAA